MKLLLDSHILLWSLLEASRLTKRVAAELENASNELWVSPLSVWEIITLAEKGRVILEPDPITWIRKVFSTVPLKEAMTSPTIFHTTGKIVGDVMAPASEERDWEVLRS